MENESSNKQESSLEAQSPLINNFIKSYVSRSFTCDHCGEEWELSFKCEQCSDKIHTEFVEKPNIHWDGNIVSGDGEMIMGDEDVPTGNVCGNCCWCHENCG